MLLRRLLALFICFYLFFFFLQVFDSTFDLRKTILAAFRDRVLSRILLNVRISLPSIQSIIFYISFVTADNSTEYVTFNSIADKALGLKTDEPESSEADNGSKNLEKVINISFLLT